MARGYAFMNSIELATEPVSAASTEDWDRVYALDPYAMPTQSSAWARAILRENGSVDCSRLYRFSDGVEAILPLFTSRLSPQSLRILRSPPAAWGFGGTISTRSLTGSHLKVILDDCKNLAGAAVQIRPNPLHAGLWGEAAEETDWQALNRNAHVLDLDGGFEEVWTKRFPGNTRNKARKAEKVGVRVETGATDELINAFDGLFRQSIVRWARRQNEFEWLASLRGRVRDPKRKFFSMARLSEGMLRVSIAWLSDKPVAGIIVLVGRNAHYTRGAMDERLIGNSRANYLLQKTAIEDACNHGCRHYHMGETGSSASLAEFKSSFGAEAVPYAEYRHERIPVMSADQKLRSTVKSLIGFKDA